VLVGPPSEQAFAEIGTGFARPGRIYELTGPRSQDLEGVAHCRRPEPSAPAALRGIEEGSLGQDPDDAAWTGLEPPAALRRL